MDTLARKHSHSYMLQQKEEEENKPIAYNKGEKIP